MATRYASSRGLACTARDAALRHKPKQQGVHLRQGTVDLVEEEDGKLPTMPQHRARIEARPAVLADRGVIDEVRRHQVDRPLDALVRPAERARQAAQQRGLADAHVPLEQHVAAGEDRDRQQPYHPRLAHDGARDLGLEAVIGFAPPA